MGVNKYSDIRLGGTRTALSHCSLQGDKILSQLVVVCLLHSLFFGHLGGEPLSRVCRDNDTETHVFNRESEAKNGISSIFAQIICCSENPPTPLSPHAWLPRPTSERGVVFVDNYE